MTEIGRRELLLGFAAMSVSKSVRGQASKATSGISESSRALVRDAVRKAGSGGRISADEVQAIARSDSRSVDAIMLDLLPIAREYSRPPLSHFMVGAVALGASGALYLGANLEVAQNALNQAVHAEQSALANAFGHREAGITAIAVTAAPCGHCRQFLNEISGASEIRVLVKGRPPRTIGELLPDAFGPADLGIAAGLFTSPAATLRLTAATRDRLAAAALDAASRAYAPHTKALSGCAVRTRSGGTHAGSYLENAAFNPSLSPLQSALVNVVFAGEDLAEITRVVLVELRGASISQRPATEAVLRVIAPKARLQVLAAARK